MPALAAVVRGQVIADVACAVRWPGRLDQDQALGRVVDVHHMHRVLVLFAVLVGVDARITNAFLPHHDASEFPVAVACRLKSFLILVADTNKSRSVI